MGDLLEPLVSVIETIKQRINVHSSVLRENETRTRLALIDPLLNALGWDTSDLTMVFPEYDVSGRKADYALLGSEKTPSATLEAKKLGEALAPHRMQMLNYSNASGVEFAGLTDGDKWEFYEVFKRGQLEERRILDISITDVPAHESALKLLLLWRPNLASGQPVAAAGPITIENSSVLSDIVTPQPDNSSPPTTTNPIVQTSGDWIPLSQIDDVTGKKAPVGIRFGDGEMRPVRAWWQVLVESAEFLVRRGALTPAHLPISNGRGLRFINSSPQSPTGRNYITPKTISSGITLETHLSSKAIVNYSKRLLTHFGTNPEAIDLRFE